MYYNKIIIKIIKIWIKIINKLNYKSIKNRYIYQIKTYKLTINKIICKFNYKMTININNNYRYNNNNKMRSFLMIIKINILSN